MSSHPEQTPETPKKESPLNKPGSVGFYLAILFAVAFLLLLLAFFMQQRANDEALGSLTQSITSIESLNQLLDENRELREELELTEDTLELTQQELEATQAELADTADSMAQMKNVLDSMKLIDELEAAFTGKEYALCLEILDSMAQSSRFTVPESAVIQNRLAEIIDTLTDLGYYTPAEDAE